MSFPLPNCTMVRSYSVLIGLRHLSHFLLHKRCSNLVLGGFQSFWQCKALAVHYNTGNGDETISRKPYLKKVLVFYLFHLPNGILLISFLYHPLIHGSTFL